MTTATSRGAARSSAPSASRTTAEPHTDTPAQRLRVSFAAVRLMISWLGVRKTLTADQRAQAADTFGAEEQYLSAAKKLLDTRHPAYKTVTAVRGKAISLWCGFTLPYPESGLRLIRQGDVESFNSLMLKIRQEVADAVDSLDQDYANLRLAARDRLGRLYNEGDYPASLKGLFSIDWDFPSVEPPDYLRRLEPDLFEQERQRVAARFDEAVQLAEEAFTAEFGKLVAHISERLSGDGADGKPKVFRDSAVENLREFFDRFRTLNIHSSAQLDELVEKAQAAVRGIAPQDLRESGSLRARVAAQLSPVQSTLDGLMVDRPRRRILRTHQQEATT